LGPASVTMEVDRIRQRTNKQDLAGWYQRENETVLSPAVRGEKLHRFGPNKDQNQEIIGQPRLIWNTAVKTVCVYYYYYYY